MFDYIGPCDYSLLYFRRGPLDYLILINLVPSTASTHFLLTLGIPFQLVEPSEAIEHGDSN